MNAMEKPDRDILLGMTDSDLLRQCRVDVQRGTGRGGQKRNKTDSSVRLTLLAIPELAVECDETRSQTRNRTLALRRLRHHLALHVRRPVSKLESEELNRIVIRRPAQANPDYPIWLALVLDHLHHCEYRVSTAAGHLKLSTGRLVRLISDDAELWRHVNRERTKRGLKRLRAD